MTDWTTRIDPSFTRAYGVDEVRDRVAGAESRPAHYRAALPLTTAHGMGDAGAASVTNNRQADPQTAGDCEPAKQCTGRGITEQVS
jgi:hypothetical protein